MLKFKDSELYVDAIKRYASSASDKLMFYCDEILNEDACEDLPENIKRTSGEETTVKQCIDTSAEIVGRYADELKQECFKLAQDASDGCNPQDILLHFDELYQELVERMCYELHVEYGGNSGSYTEALNHFRRTCLRPSESPSLVVPSFLDVLNTAGRLDSLIEWRNLTAWRPVFKNDDWKESVILHRAEDGLPKIVYDSLRRAQGDLGEAVWITLNIVREEFFVETLGGELRAVAIDRLEPNDDLKTLLDTVDDVATNAFYKLMRQIEEQAKAIAEPMLAEFKAE